MAIANRHRLKGVELEKANIEMGIIPEVEEVKEVKEVKEKKK